MYKKVGFPEKIDEFIGNNNAKLQLKMLLSNTLTQNKVFPDILFYGNPGLGKTTLAEIIASELDTRNYQYFIGNQITPNILEKFLWSSVDKDVLFIDEIHSMNKECFDLFLPILQSRKCKIKDITDPDTLVNIDVPMFPIIGATTDLGNVPKPLIDRFKYRINLCEYSQRELYEILIQLNKISVKKDGINITQEAAIQLIAISQNVPRILKHLYYQSIDISFYKKIKTISGKEVQEIMKLNHINENGFDYLQQVYIKFLKTKTTPTGLSAISAGIQYPQKDIEILIEPYLIKTGVIERTSKGRILINKDINLTV